MIDRSLPFFPITLCKTDTNEYPRYTLPQGYTFDFYKKGDEEAWAKLECELGQFESVEKGVTHFWKTFFDDSSLRLEDRMLFVRDPQGEAVATATLWDGMFLGKREQRLHWIAVSDRCVGKGIAKALICRLLDMYRELGYEGFIYLLTATWYYPAINIYKKFGFVEYEGSASLVDGMDDEKFMEENKKAIAIVREKLFEYSKK